MGKYEEKIKQELLSEIFAQSTKIYELIELRFKLTPQANAQLIAKINGLNDDLTDILRDIELL